MLWLMVQEIIIKCNKKMSAILIHFYCLGIGFNDQKKYTWVVQQGGGEGQVQINQTPLQQTSNSMDVAKGRLPANFTVWKKT